MMPGIRGSQKGVEPGAGGGMAGGDASGASAEAGAWERRGAGGEGEGVGESRGGAPISDAEAVVRLRPEPAPEPHRGYANGGWRRTWSGSRSCSGWVTCRRGRVNWRRSAQLLRDNAVLRAASSLEQPSQGRNSRARRQTPDWSSHPFRSSVIHNLGQYLLVQRIPSSPSEKRGW